MNINQYTTSCARGDTIYPRPARCTHAAAHLQSMPTRLTPATPSAPCSMNIHDRQASSRALGGGIETGLVDIH